MTALAPSRLETKLPDDKPLYTEAEARAEADRCLYCVDAPCIKACPTSIDIPTFIRKIATGNVHGAARTILEQNILGYSCARVCPVEVLCVGDCVYQGWHGPPIPIGRLQRFATETVRTRASANGETVVASKKTDNPRKVALIGGGPASLACAAHLALAGHRPVILEKNDVLGGLNTTGIAPYKMHASDAVSEAEWVRSLGVEVRSGVTVGKTVHGKELLAEYDAVFIGVGLGADTMLGVPGEEGGGVLGATAWIETMKLSSAGSEKLGKVVVVGGGNTAVDMARECARLGAESVTMVYRRGASAMSAYAHELASARKEGVSVLTSVLPVRFLRDASGVLRGITLIHTDENAKPREGSDHVLACDLVGLAIGQSKVKAIASELAGVTVDALGRIEVDAQQRTKNPKVYAGGDCVNGGKEVVNAVAEGRDAAKAMMKSWENEAPRG